MHLAINSITCREYANQADIILDIALPMQPRDPDVRVALAELVNAIEALAGGFVKGLAERQP